MAQIRMFLTFYSPDLYVKDGIPEDRSLGGSYNIAFFSAAIKDMIKPFELEGAEHCGRRRFLLYDHTTHRKKFRDV